jgi:hypothetical protein
MAYTLKAFAEDCRHILEADPGPAGRQKVRDQLQKLLMEDEFVARYCGPDATAGANLLYEDPELGFQILAHVMEREHAGGVHDHGSSWAIYGQAVKHTDMTEWKRRDAGSRPGRATVVKERSYRLERGQAGIFDNRRIHSIAYPAGARFIRVTGTNLETVPRGRYDVEKGTMVVEKRPNFRGAA